ncbi:MAG: hypothetical protein AB2L14_36040 [Candidatus Xenobiia bacterium LiM19]
MGKRDRLLSKSCIDQIGSYPNSFSDTSHKPWLTGYKIYIPFSVSQNPNNSSAGTVNASFIYNATGGFSGNSSTNTSDYALYYGIFSENTDTQGTTDLVNSNNQFGGSVFWNGTTQFGFTPGRNYDLNCVCFYINNPTGTFSQSLSWNLQILFRLFKHDVFSLTIVKR